MEIGEMNYSLISSPYDSFMTKHLQHYGYFTGRGEIIKKYGFFPSKPLIPSSSESDSSSSDDEDEKYKKSSVSDGRPLLRQARIPFGFMPRGGANDDYSNEPRWPIEVEVLNEPRVKHISISPSYPEPFHKSTLTAGPFLRSNDENISRVVYNYNPEGCGYFIRSRIGGNREGCRQAAVTLQNSQDTTILFESRFECGNLMKAVQVGEFDYELYLRYDLYTKRNTQWFYFRMQNIRADKRYRFTIVNFFKPTSLYSCGMKPLMYSVNDAEDKGIGWQRCGEDIVYYKNNLPAPDNSSTTMYSLSWTCKFPNNNDTYYFAHCYPYTYSDLQDYLTEIQNDPFKSQYCKQKILCRTLAGNLIYLLTITNPIVNQSNAKNALPENQIKKGVVLTARVHPGETNASWMMKGLLDFLLGDSHDAKLLRESFIFKIVPMLNPDGVIVGNYRCSLSGRDLNRNYKTILKDAYPSIWHTREMIKRFMNETEIVLYCDFHGHSRKQNVFVYGCENKHLPNERLKERIFPAMLAKNDPTKFSFSSSKFKIQKHKEGTGRVVMWSLGIKNSYTLEATFCGSTQKERAGHHFNIKDLESIGYHFLDSLLDYCDPDKTKQNRILYELQDNFRRKIQMRLLANGVNPASLADIDLDQFSSDDDDDSDDVGSDSSADDGLPKHLEVIAAAKAALQKKTRKKPPPSKNSKDTKKKDDLDKENLEKNKTVGLPLSKLRSSQFPNITSDMAKPMSSGSLRRLKDNNNESGRYESASSISGRQNRWATFTSSQGPNDRSTPAEEKARKSQVAYYKNLLLDGTEDDREKQPTQSKTDSLDDDFTLTSTFFPKHPTSSENAQNEDYPVPHPTGPSYQSSEVIEPALTNESRDVFTATYLIRRLNALERDTSNIHSASGNYQNMSSNSRIDDDTNIQTATDTDGDYEQSRMNQSNPPEEGRHSSNAFVTSRVAAHLSDRILGTSRPIPRPKSTTITTLQNRTVLDIKSIQPPMQPPHLRRIAEQQYHQRQRVMMVFGKQTINEPAEKSNLVPARTYHLSMNERRPDDLSMNYDSSSSVVSRLHPIPQDNYVPNTSTRFDSASFNKSQTIRISSVKKSSK